MARELLKRHGSRLVYKSLDGMMTASLRPRRGAAALLRSILHPYSKHYDRIGSLVNLVNAVIPGAEERLYSYLYSGRHLPFAEARAELIGYGSGATVFRLPLAGGSQVLKIYRKSLGQNRKRLAALARTYREQYETVSSWYREAPALVAPSSYLLLGAPLLGLRGVGCIQSFIPGEKRDFFEEFSDGELMGLIERQNSLREQFLVFARETLHIASTQKLCVDFLGRANLLVTCGESPSRLCLIDYRIFDLNRLEKQSPATFMWIAQRLHRLEQLLEGASLLERKVSPTLDR